MTLTAETVRKEIQELEEKLRLRKAQLVELTAVAYIAVFYSGAGEILTIPLDGTVKSDVVNAEFMLNKEKLEVIIVVAPSNPDHRTGIPLVIDSQLLILGSISVQAYSTHERAEAGLNNLMQTDGESSDPE